MKVTHLISGSEAGGSRFQVLSLLEELTKNQTGNQTINKTINKTENRAVGDIDVELVSLMEGPLTEDARERGLPIQVFPMKNICDFSVLKPLTRYLADSGSDILHTHGVRANFIGRLTQKFMATELKPVLFSTVHSSIYYDYKNSWKRFIYPPLEKSMRGSVTQFIAVSQGLYRELQSDGIAEDRLSLIPNGIYTDKFNSKTGEKKRSGVDCVGSEDEPRSSGDILRSELGIPKDAGVILSVGRLVPVKGHSYLLQGFSRLLQDENNKQNENNGQNLYLVLVGDGPDQDKLSRQGEELSISDRLIFAGYRKDIPDFFDMADLFALPSLMEGMPIILLEAMAAGLPLVASDVGGVPEVVTHEQTGLLVPSADPDSLADALERLWQSAELRHNLSGTARDVVEEEYHFSRVVNDTLELYQQTLR